MSELPELSSERLELRAWHVDDAPGALEMYGNPEVVRYIGNETVGSLQEMREKLAAWIAATPSNGPGLGTWCVRHEGEIVGAAMLNRPRDLQGQRDRSVVQVGWHLAPRVWGRGLATEAGRRLLRYGFETLGLSRIICLVEPPNTASIRVAERLGMAHVGRTTQYYEGLALELYESMPS